MRTVVVIPCRFDSSRLPGKALMPMAGEPMLKRVLERVGRTPSIDAVMVATTVLPSDDPVAELAEAEGALTFRGDPDDVLGRIDEAARQARADVVVEVMGDSPLIHHALIEDTIAVHRTGGFDYAAGYSKTVVLPGHGERAAFPVGMTAQVFTRAALARCAAEKTDAYSREHSTSSMYSDPDTFRLGYLEAEGRWSDAHRPDLFLAVNLREQYDLVAGVFERCLPEDPDFGPLAAIRAADAILASPA